MFQARSDANTGNLILTCASYGVFPQPVMSIWKQQIVTSDIGEYKHNYKYNNYSRISSKFKMVTQNISINNSSNLFDTYVSYLFDDKEMEETANTRDVKVFECRIGIKEANYKATKRITLYSSK